MASNLKKDKIKKKEKEEEEKLDILNVYYVNAARIQISEEDFAVELYQEPPFTDGTCKGLRLYMNPKFVERFIDGLREASEDFKKTQHRKKD